MRLSNRDLEELSAYLDGEIPRKERDRLEARLQSEATLSEALDQLQRTRAMVRSLPVLRAPRNFYVTPGMVGRRKPASRAFPVLSFASVLASVLFVLIFLGDLFVVRSPALSPLFTGRYSEQIQELAEPAAAVPQELKSEIPETQVERLIEEPAAEEEAAPPLVEATGELERLLTTDVPAPAEDFEGKLGEGITQGEEPRIVAEGHASVTPIPDESRVVFPLRELVLGVEVILVVVAIMTGLAAFSLYRRLG